jgi:hypothetical protein
VSTDKNYLLGKWQAVNRMYFVKKHGDFSVPLCYWSMLGEILLNIVTGIWRWDVGRLRRGMGNCAGLYMVACGRIQRIGGVFK